jgi:hypothetical protein
MGLSFLYPAFLVGLAAIAVPILLHLLKREAAPRVPFSAVRLLKRAPVEQTRHKRLRELLLLALRVSALALLALAFARPFFSSDAVGAAAEVTVVAVDTSYSMSGPGRFDEAKRRAREAVRRAASGHAVAVMTFDDAAATLVDPTMDRGAASSAVDRLTAGFGATRYRTALAHASRIVGSRSGRIVVVTDLQQSGWEGGAEAAVPARLPVEVLDVGAAPANLAVVDIRRDGAETVVAVRNTGTVGADTRVRLSIDGQPQTTLPLATGPGVVSEARFALALPLTGTAMAAVHDPRGAAADDVRYVVLDPASPPSVLMVTSAGRGAGSLYLERALEVADGVERFRVDTVGGRDGVISETSLEGRGALILAATRGIDRRGRELLASFVSRGGGLLVLGGPDIDPAAVAALFGGAPAIAFGEPEELAAPVHLAVSDPRHPVLRALGVVADSLGRARFSRVRTIDDGGMARVLARFSDGRPALVEYRVGLGRVLAFASDANNRWNDLPLQPVFVPFVHEVLQYLVNQRAQPREYLIADVPPGVAPTPGIATLDGGRRRIAVNVDPREASSARTDVAEFNKAIARMNQAAASEARADARQAEAEQSLWRYGLMVMLAALALEGLVGSRMA